jgi:H+-transporting ATPase
MVSIIAEKKANPCLKFLSYFWGPIPWMIEVAIILSALVRHWTDFGIILVLLIMNSVVGFWEEYQAGNAIEALKKKLAIQARVKRDGNWILIPPGSWFLVILSVYGLGISFPQTRAY